jgi:hypothetical protein
MKKLIVKISPEHTPADAHAIDFPVLVRAFIFMGELCLPKIF